MNSLMRCVKRHFSDGTIQHTANIRRFYNRVDFAKTESTSNRIVHPLHQYKILLDGKTIKTPYRHELAVPSKALAALVCCQFNWQDEFLKSGEMPMLALSRTAVDTDIEPHLRENLESSVYQFLKTDSLLFYEENFGKEYDETVRPLLEQFGSHFKVKLEPSYTLEPPVSQVSDEFRKWVQGLNSWQLIGLETITIWCKSTIGAYAMLETTIDSDKLLRAVCLEEYTQMEENGEVDDKIMAFNQLKLMVSCGQMMYKFGQAD